MKYYKTCKNGENPYLDLSKYMEFVVWSEPKIDKTSDSFKIAVAFLYGSINGIFNAQQLAWCVNMKIKLAADTVRNLKRSKVWIQKGKKRNNECFKRWSNTGDRLVFKQMLSFWLDVSVAIGGIVKVKNKYGLREWVEPSFSKRFKNQIRWKELESRKRLND